MKAQTPQTSQIPEALVESDCFEFVPDDLEFGCSEGVKIFRVQSLPYQSYIAKR